MTKHTLFLAGVSALCALAFSALPGQAKPSRAERQAATLPSVAGSPAQREAQRPATIGWNTRNASGNLGGPSTGGGNGGGP